MEQSKRKTVESFIKHTDFMPKLRAALETVEQSNGFAVFEGLQTKGTCIVAITFDGKTVRLAAAAPVSRRPELRAKEEATKNPEKTEKKVVPGEQTKK